MKIQYLIILLVGCFSLGVKAQSPTAPALGFNVFVQKNATLTTNETEGPVAIGRDLTIGGNYQVSTNQSGTFMSGPVKVTLVIGGRVNYNNGVLQVNQNGYVKIGDSANTNKVWYRDNNNAASPIRITPTSNYNSASRINLQANAVNLGVSAASNPVFQGGLIDFDAAFTQMKKSSISIAACADNAVITNPNGGIIPHTGLPGQIKITLNTGVNVLNVTGADLNNLSSITFNNQPSATRILIINVNTADTFNWTTCNSAGIGQSQCPFIMYNFYNTTYLNIRGSSTVEGTIFAPKADIVKTVNQANIEGQVIGQSYIHSGGENHHAVFTPSVTGCIFPPVASFTINSQSQCMNTNSFVFTANPSGTAPFTYLWSFGDGTTSTAANPVKKYAAAGTYSVKLKVTNSLGEDSMTTSVTVLVVPSTGFTVNKTIQELTGNIFVFTSASPVPANSIQWLFGDGTTSLVVDPTKSYSATGPYQVKQVVTNTAGCRDTSTQTVIVSSDSVSSGNGGGLESESLGGLVSKRDYRFAKNSIDRKINYAASPVFVASPKISGFGKTGGAQGLADMLPAELEAGDVLHVSTPTDLVAITSALEVLSVDYTRNNQAKAVVLGIKTKDKAYSHTKYICDRLRGAKLLSVDSVSVKGYSFIRFVLMQEDGTVEFGTSFVAGKKEGRNEYTLQTNWLLADYEGDDTLFTFQVWATQPEYTNKLVGDIIDNLTGSMEVKQLNSVTIPTVYITQGYRERENLVLHISNTGAAINARLEMQEKRNEQSGYTSLNADLTIMPGQELVYKVPVKDGYEYDANMYTGTVLIDKVYMADGNWSLDYDNNYTTVNHFVTGNDTARAYNGNEYSVYRNVSLNAHSNDYITLFKSVKQGGGKTDLSAYRNVTFFARGKGALQITLTRDSIVQWQSQYKTSIILTDSGKMYTVPFADFRSYNISEPFSPSDVKMIMFTFAAQTTAKEEFDLSVGSIAFGKTLPTGLAKVSNSNTAVSVYPNPNNGSFSFSFTSDKQEDVQLVVRDILGKEVYTSTIAAQPGSNTVELDLTGALPRTGLLFLSVQSKTTAYGTTRVLINK
jgi:choice-of-anchor A domain-containing protein